MFHLKVSEVCECFCAFHSVNDCVVNCLMTCEVCAQRYKNIRMIMVNLFLSDVQYR